MTAVFDNPSFERIITESLHGPQYVRAVLCARSQRLKIYYHPKSIKGLDYPLRGIA